MMNKIVGATIGRLLYLFMAVNDHLYINLFIHLSISSGEVTNYLIVNITGL